MKLSQAQEEIPPERSMKMSQTEQTIRRFICTMMNESLDLLLHTCIKSLPVNSTEHALYSIQKVM